MSYRILRLQNLQIEALQRRAGELALGFAQGRIEKTMDRAEQRTLWRQAGEIVVADAREEESGPEVPFVILDGDVEDGLYTQRNMVRIPLDASGPVRLRLRLAGRDGPWRVTGARIQLRLDGKPRYLRHLDD